ncbi:hypothetical protein [Agromyces sp. CCNWLW203]|uniref:hypothetical protein n=1 Tax=Agromyces sp. CCNWLW203 TaxID=3112842 RepID=UPI002F961EC4
MILANAADQPAAIDPTFLVSIFGAVIVSAIVSIALAGWQSKRDHARWLRERRYDGFTRVVALADRFARHRAAGVVMMARVAELEAAVAAGDASVAEERHDLSESIASNLEQVRPIQDELTDVVAALEILGPNDLLDALNGFTDTMAGEDADAAAQAKEAFVLAVRRTLKITA